MMCFRIQHNKLVNKHRKCVDIHMERIVKIICELKLLQKRIHEHGKFYLTIRFYFQIKYLCRFAQSIAEFKNVDSFIIVKRSIFLSCFGIHSFFIPNLGLRKYPNFSFWKELIRICNEKIEFLNIITIVGNTNRQSQFFLAEFLVRQGRNRW